MKSLKSVSFQWCEEPHLLFLTPGGGINYFLIPIHNSKYYLYLVKIRRNNHSVTPLRHLETLSLPLLAPDYSSTANIKKENICWNRRSPVVFSHAVSNSIKSLLDTDECVVINDKAYNEVNNGRKPSKIFFCLVFVSFLFLPASGFINIKYLSFHKQFQVWNGSLIGFLASTETRCENYRTLETNGSDMGWRNLAIFMYLILKPFFFPLSCFNLSSFMFT